MKKKKKHVFKRITFKISSYFSYVNISKICKFDLNKNMFRFAEFNIVKVRSHLIIYVFPDEGSALKWAQIYSQN